MTVEQYEKLKYGVYSPVDNMFSGHLEHMPTSELLSILLRSSKLETNFSLAGRIIQDYGVNPIRKIKNPEQVMNEYGVSRYNAAIIVACFEIADRLSSQGKRLFVRGPEDVYEYMKHIKHNRKEVMYALYLNVKNVMIHEEVISMGTLSETPIHAREIFHKAIEICAASVVLVHNHPSGTYEPSLADDNVTRSIKEASDLLRIPLIDHVIIADCGYYSYNKERRI